MKGEKIKKLVFRMLNPDKDLFEFLPDTSGNYIIALKHSAKLPKVSIGPALCQYCYNGCCYDVIYTGISKKSLKNRDYKQHFAGNNSGKSTLRKSLGSLMGFKKIPRDKNNPFNGKTKFLEVDENKLSEWMKHNLLLFFREEKNVINIEEIEKELINSYNPPLNIKMNNNTINEDFRELLKELRKK